MLCPSSSIDNDTLPQYKSQCYQSDLCVSDRIRSQAASTMFRGHTTAATQCQKETDGRHLDFKDDKIQ